MKQTIAFLLFIQVSILSHSQILYGLRAGANIATTKNLIAFPEARIGWFAGMAIQIPINKKLSFQPELIYSSKGDKAQELNGQDFIKLKLNYLNAPVLLNYRFDCRTSILFGPELGYLLNARWVLEENNLDITKQYPPRFDFAAIIGIQHYLPNGIGFEARYNYGFNTLYSVDAVGNRYSDSKGANRVFQFGITYKFSIHKHATKNDKL
jgi:hypothetical protein